MQKLKVLTILDVFKDSKNIKIYFNNNSCIGIEDFKYVQYDRDYIYIKEQNSYIFIHYEEITKIIAHGFIGRIKKYKNNYSILYKMYVLEVI